jgi:ribosome maturation factor RimP
MATPDQVQEVIEPALSERGLLVDEVVITPAGRRSVLRISVDRDLGADDSAPTTDATDPLSLDEVAEATRAINAVLDPSDVMGEAPYVLEVSSPGVSRPLTEPRHFRRNIGRLVAVTPTEGEAFTGRLLSADGQAATYTLGDEGEQRSVPYDTVRKAVVQVEFNRPDTDDTDADAEWAHGSAGEA